MTKVLVDADTIDVEQTEEQKQASKDRAKQIEEIEAETKTLEEANKKAADKAVGDAPDPNNVEEWDQFSSLLPRDTTHFQNVHYQDGGAVDTIAGHSSTDRQAAAAALLQATGHNVNAAVGWDDASRAAVLAYQGDGGTGEMDRATWDKLSDDLFDSGKGKDSRSKHGPEPKQQPVAAKK